MVEAVTFRPTTTGRVAEPAQQARFDDFIDEYNTNRPHHAIGMKYPAELYTPSRRAYRVPDEPDYPLHDRTIRITNWGRICIGKRKINLSRVFAGQLVGIKEVADQIWLVTFMAYDLGFFDQDEGHVQPAPNPFIPNCYLCLRYELSPMSPGRTIKYWWRRRHSHCLMNQYLELPSARNAPENTPDFKQYRLPTSAKHSRRGSFHHGRAKATTQSPGVVPSTECPPAATTMYCRPCQT